MILRCLKFRCFDAVAMTYHFPYTSHVSLVMVISNLIRHKIIMVWFHIWTFTGWLFPHTLHVLMQLFPHCAPHTVAYILELLPMRHCAGCQFYRAESRGQSWDSEGNHIKNVRYAFTSMSLYNYQCNYVINICFKSFTFIAI